MKQPPDTAPVGCSRVLFLITAIAISTTGATLVGACGPADLGDIAYFRDDFSTGDLSRWQRPADPGAGGSGIGPYTFAGGSMDVVPAPDTGNPLLSFQLQQSPGRNEQAGLVRPSAPVSETYFSAWFLVPAAATIPQAWSIMQFRGQEPGSDAASDILYELQLRNTSDGSMGLVLGHHDPGQPEATIEPIIPVDPITPGRWLHLEMGVGQTTDQTGWVSVWRDGRKTFDVREVATLIIPDRAIWLVVSIARDVAPAPLNLLVDDVTMTPIPWHPYRGQR